MWGHAAKGALIGGGIVLACVLGAVFVFACVLYAHIVQSPFPRTFPTVAAETVPWRTGDVVITQSHRPEFKRAFLEGLPSHAALIWVHPEHGPCVVETSHTDAPSGKEPPCVLTGEATYSGTRVTRIEDYARAYPKDLKFRRPYNGPEIDTTRMEAAVRAELDTPFEPFLIRVHPVFVTAVALGSAWPAVGDALLALCPRSTEAIDGTDAKNTRRNRGNRTRSVFCSELVVRLLQDVGVVDEQAHTALSPLSLSSYSQRLDKLVKSNNQSPTSETTSEPMWGTEVFVDFTNIVESTRIQ